MYLDCRLHIIRSVPLNFLLVKARAVIYGWMTYLLAKCFASCGALRYALFLLFRFIIRTFSSVSFSSILVVLMFYFQQGGQCELEVVGKKGVVQLNVRPINPGTKVSLTGGDEVIFSSCHSMLMYPTIISWSFSDAVLVSLSSLLSYLEYVL
jgi:hypothetical protein